MSKDKPEFDEKAAEEFIKPVKDWAKKHPEEFKKIYEHAQERVDELERKWLKGLGFNSKDEWREHRKSNK